MHALLLAVRQSAASPIGESGGRCTRYARIGGGDCLRLVDGEYLIAAGDGPERYSSDGWKFAVDYRGWRSRAAPWLDRSHR